MKSKLRSQFFWIIICGLLSLYSPNLFGQGANTYDFSTGTSASLEDMSTGATQIIAAAQGDVASAVTNIGFTFRFAGVDYTQFSANSNGLMRLGSTVVSTAYSNSLNSGSDDPKITAYWDDICTGKTSGYVNYKLFGSGSSRYLVVEWNVNLANSTTTTPTGKFQVILYETSNIVKFIYGTMASSSTYSVGLVSASGNYNSITTTTNTTSYTTVNNSNSSVIASGRYYTYTPGYCRPTYTSCSTSGDGITNVSLNNLNNASTCASSPFYTYYNAATIPNLSPGSAQTLTVDLGSPSTGGSRFAGAWIDFNQDKTFEASEFIGNNTVSGSPVVINFTVPAGAILGNTRMRIRGGDDDQVISSEMCGASSSSYGEAEDYIVNICTGPAFTTQPSNQTICAPNSVNFSVVATGATSYQWRKNGTNLTNGGNISGATTTNLSFSSTSASDAGSYDCIVYNATCNSQSNTATLTINSNPTITVQPVNTAACEGSNATLSITALGNGITYQWYKNGVLMSNSGNISGATSNTLVFGPAGTTDAANYYCVISGATPCVGTVTSNTIALTLTASPSVPSTTGASRCGAGSVTLSASGAVANESYLWYNAGIGGSMIAAMVSSYATPSIAVTTNYFVTKVNTVTGCESTPRTPVTATINNAPAITTNPSSQSIGVDGTASFHVIAANTTGYQWEVSTDGGTIWNNLTDGGIYSTVTTATLNISAAPVGMNGYKYRCTVSGNCAPTATSAAGTLTVSNDYSMPSGTGNTRTTCSTNFYDNGGSAGNYTNNFDGTTTFYPAIVGNKIKIDFASYTGEPSFDKIYLYDGNSTSATVLLNGVSANGIPAGNPFTSTATDGSLTFRFISDGGTNNAGWAATVSCIAGPSMTFTSSTTSTASTTSVTQSATMEPVICIKVVTANSASPFNATQFQINMTGTTAISDVTSVKIYSTGSDPVFGTSSLFGSATPATGTITVNGSKTLVQDTNYFWVAYDISATAVVANLLDAQCTQITMDGSVGNKVPTVQNPSGNRPIVAIPYYFIKKVGTNGWARSIVEDPSDQGLVMVGNASNGSNSDFSIVKTDKYGTFLWSKNIGGSSEDYGYDITTSGDGGFVFVGYSTSSNLQPDGSGIDANIVVSKINSTGTVQWTTTVGGSSSDQGASIVRTSDDGFAVTGTYDDGSPCFYLMKLSSTGAITNTLTLRISALSARATSLIQTSDGGFLIAGNTTSSANQNDFLLVKIKNNYTFDWSMTWGGTQPDYLYSVIENSPNDYTTFGGTFSFGNGLDAGKSTTNDIYAMRFSNSGSGATVKWSSVYSSAAGNEEIRDVIATSNGGYMMTGYTDGIGAGGNEIYILSLDNSAGNIRWSTTLGTVSGDEGCALVKTADGGYVVAALGEQGSASGSMMYLVKVKDTPQYACSFTGNGGTKTALAKPTITYPIVTAGQMVFSAAPSGQSSIQITATTTVAAGEAIVNVCSNVTLPIELLSFTANCKKDKVNCKWITASEINNNFFTLERSNDASHFEAVATINGAGNSNSELSYEYIDSPSDFKTTNTYYRLKQTDFDGKFTYSGIVAAKCNNSENELDCNVYPNPTNQVLTVDFADDISEEFSVEIKNCLGQVVLEQKMPAGTHKIQLSMTDLIDGTYFISVMNKHQYFTHKIIKINQ